MKKHRGEFWPLELEVARLVRCSPEFSREMAMISNFLVFRQIFLDITNKLYSRETFSIPPNSGESFPFLANSNGLLSPEKLIPE